MRPGPATSSPRCCPSASGSKAPSTLAPWLPATNSPTGPGKQVNGLIQQPAGIARTKDAWFTSRRLIKAALASRDATRRANLGAYRA